ncbi:MAG: hypothetical protein JXQ75_11845 [Phycisphaerae bacterium]|nr:hypothetical protein [Phycisphaerae bacterium]
MKLPTSHRKRVKHHDEPGQGHELTFSCYNRLPLLDDDHRCQRLAVAVDRAVGRHVFSLLAFVFMPEHVHLIVFPERLGATGGLPASAEPGHGPEPTARISDLLYAIKRPASYRIKQDLLVSKDPLLEKLTIRERPGRTAFRFWQEGSGYDRNILDHGSLRKMIDYVHLNPVRRGMVDHPREWKWSSWRHYEGESNTADAGLPNINVLI